MTFRRAGESPRGCAAPRVARANPAAPSCWWDRDESRVHIEDEILTIFRSADGPHLHGARRGPRRIPSDRGENDPRRRAGAGATRLLRFLSGNWAGGRVSGSDFPTRSGGEGRSRDCRDGHGEARRTAHRDGYPERWRRRTPAEPPASGARAPLCSDWLPARRQWRHSQSPCRESAGSSAARRPDRSCSGLRSAM